MKFGSFAILVLISGLSQVLAVNYCNRFGTYCNVCVSVGNDQSCTDCGMMGVSTPVQGSPGVRQCVQGTAKNCVIADEKTTCQRCKPGYGLQPTDNQCIETNLEIDNCVSYGRLFSRTVCFQCINSTMNSEMQDKCDQTPSDPYCYSAIYSKYNGEKCLVCKNGVAKLSDDKSACIASVPQALEGCMMMDSERKRCLYCNSEFGYFMTNVGVCSKKTEPAPDILKKLNVAYPKLTPTQKENAQQIYVEFVNAGFTLDSHFAYGLATAVVQGEFVPLPEARAPPNTEKRKEQDQYWYTGFYGRGYVQLTWNYNYQQLAALIKADIFNNPDQALDPVIAARIMAVGMKNGSFTGKQLELYLNKNTLDLINARRVIDTTLKDAALYAEVAENILSAKL